MLLRIFFIEAIRIPILNNQSTTTKTYSLPCLVEGRPNMYSIEMDSQRLFKVSRGVYRPFFLMKKVVLDLLPFYAFNVVIF